MTGQRVKYIFKRCMLAGIIMNIAFYTYLYIYKNDMFNEIFNGIYHMIF